MAGTLITVIDPGSVGDVVASLKLFLSEAYPEADELVVTEKNRFGPLLINGPMIDPRRERYGEITILVQTPSPYAEELISTMGRFSEEHCLPIEMDHKK